MRALHGSWFYVAVVGTGIVGLWGVLLATLKRRPGRSFYVGVGAGIVVMLVQVGLGLLTYSQGYRPASDFHIFYGFVVLFTFAFAYIFRAQLSRRPALYWGLLLLFVMGLGIRAWTTVN